MTHSQIKKAAGKKHTMKYTMKAPNTASPPWILSRYMSSDDGEKRPNVRFQWPLEMEAALSCWMSAGGNPIWPEHANAAMGRTSSAQWLSRPSKFWPLMSLQTDWNIFSHSWRAPAQACTCLTPHPVSWMILVAFRSTGLRVDILKTLYESPKLSGLVWLAPT